MSWVVGRGWRVVGGGRGSWVWVVGVGVGQKSVEKMINESI